MFVPASNRSKFAQVNQSLSPPNFFANLCWVANFLARMNMNASLITRVNKYVCALSYICELNSVSSLDKVIFTCLGGFFSLFLSVLFGKDSSASSLNVLS